MANISKMLYSLAAGANLIERGNKDDPFHQIIFSVTGKTSTKELTNQEAELVKHEIMERMKLVHKAPTKKNKPKLESQPGMMTAAQQRLAWRYIYRLQELSPSNATVGDRMHGAIIKILAITPNMKDPFRWVSFENGEKLIEVLKKYVLSAERKRKKAGAG